MLSPETTGTKVAMMSAPPEKSIRAGYRQRGWAVVSHGPTSASLPSNWAASLGGGPVDGSQKPNLLTLSWGGATPASSIPGGLGPHPDLSTPPPFAAVTTSGSAVRVEVDPLGFCHVYTRQLPGLAVVSTSARAAGLVGAGELCRESVAAQSLLGWQLGTRTMFAGVHKIGPAGSATLSEGRLDTHEPRRAFDSRVPADPAAAARAAAGMLRDIVAAHLDEHPDAELQLTGGLDSRILLAAVPPSRRRGLAAMTLTVPGSQDTRIAAELSVRWELRHRQTSFAGLAELEPHEAFALCLTAARRVDSAADPLALAAVDFAELALEPRPRIGGLGGEVARGFYYFGPVLDVAVTRHRVDRLARWRMFTNEAAPAAMFVADFARWATNSAVEDVYDAFRATGLDWFRAMDEFYLGQRMHRWAGVLGSATALERPVLHPMLDQRFLDIARGVAPAAKKNARFLSQILVELDAELADIALDGRPAPISYVQPSLRSRSLVAATTVRKVRSKITQRLTQQHRAPEGGEVLAALVTRHLRSNPDLLTGVTALGILDEHWLERMIQGAQPVETSAASMLISLLATQPAS